MTLKEWQKLLKEAADRKYPNNLEGTFDRISSIQRQLDDVKAALAVESGELVSDHHAHQDPNHRLSALVVDILIFAEERGANVENELEVILAWFEDNYEESLD